MSFKRIVQRRATYKTRPFWWAITSYFFIGAAFTAMAFRIFADRFQIDGLFLLGMVLFGIGLICALCQMEATERWESRL